MKTCNTDVTENWIPSKTGGRNGDFQQEHDDWPLDRRIFHGFVPAIFLQPGAASLNLHGAAWKKLHSRGRYSPWLLFEYENIRKPFFCKSVAFFCQLLTERQNWYWGTWGTKMLWTPPHVGGFQSSSIYIAQTNLDIQDQSIQSISISFQGVCKTAVKEFVVSTTRTRKQQIPISELGQLTTKWEYWRQLWYPYGSLSVYPPCPPGYMHKREGIGVPRPSVSIHAVNFSPHNFDRSFENRTSRRSIRWRLLAGISQGAGSKCFVYCSCMTSVINALRSQEDRPGSHRIQRTSKI